MCGNTGPYKYDQRVDVWAAGVIMCQMLTGRTPFDEDGPAALIERVNKAELFDDAGEWREGSSHNYMLVAPVAYDLDMQFERLIAGEEDHTNGDQSDTGEDSSACLVRADSVATIDSMPRRSAGISLCNSLTSTESRLCRSFCSFGSAGTIIARAGSIELSSLGSEDRPAPMKPRSPLLPPSNRNARNVKSIRRQPTSLFGQGCLRLDISRKNECGEDVEINRSRRFSNSLRHKMRRRGRAQPEEDMYDLRNSIRRYSMPDLCKIANIGKLQPPTELEGEKECPVKKSMLKPSAYFQNLTTNDSQSNQKCLKSGKGVAFSLAMESNSWNESSTNPGVVSVARRPRSRSKSICFGNKKLEPVSPSVESYEPRKERIPSNEIYRFRFNMDGDEWEHVSPAAKDLVRLLLTLDSERRPTADQALQHEWFTSNAGSQSSSTKCGSELGCSIDRSNSPTSSNVSTKSGGKNMTDAYELDSETSQADDSYGFNMANRLPIVADATQLCPTTSFDTRRHSFVTEPEPIPIAAHETHSATTSTAQRKIIHQTSLQNGFSSEVSLSDSSSSFLVSPSLLAASDFCSPLKCVEISRQPTLLIESDDMSFNNNIKRSLSADSYSTNLSCADFLDQLRRRVSTEYSEFYLIVKEPGTLAPSSARRAVSFCRSVSESKMNSHFNKPSFTSGHDNRDPESIPLSRKSRSFSSGLSLLEICDLAAPKTPGPAQKSLARRRHSTGSGHSDRKSCASASESRRRRDSETGQRFLSYHRHPDCSKQRTVSDAAALSSHYDTDVHESKQEAHKIPAEVRERWKVSCNVYSIYSNSCIVPAIQKG